MVDNKDILKMKIPSACYVKGCERWNRMPKGKSHVFTESPEKTLMGFVAEEFLHHLMPKMTPSAGHDVYGYDFLFFGKKLEIKNKCVNSVPRPSYDVSTSYGAYDQPCDVYFFTRCAETYGDSCFEGKFVLADTIKPEMVERLVHNLSQKFPFIYLLGFIGKEEFNQNGFRVLPGTVLGNGSRAKGDTWNSTINLLRPTKTLLDGYAVQSANRQTIEECILTA